MTNKVFLDTAYAIALSVESDEHHERAEELADQLEAEATQLVTTRAVLLEIGNALSKKRYRKAALELLDALEQDPLVEIVPLSEELYKQRLSDNIHGKRILAMGGVSRHVDFFRFFRPRRRGR
ncbi:MAG: type II toxin-antitoxin system VapC family toxin [Pyrinomonadaceae bacterium]